MSRGKHSEAEMIAEGSFNFTWGFYRDFDLTLILQIMSRSSETLVASSPPARS